MLSIYTPTLQDKTVSSQIFIIGYYYFLVLPIRQAQYQCVVFIYIKKITRKSEQPFNNLNEMVISFTHFSTAMFLVLNSQKWFLVSLKGNTCVCNYTQRARPPYILHSYLCHQASLCHPVNWFLLWLPSLWPLPCVCWPGCKFDWPVEQVL